MEIIKLTGNNLNKIVEQAFQLIKADGVVVTPSETQYGLSCDPSSQAATKKIYSIKGRDFSHPLPLVVGSQDIIKKYFIVNGLEQKAMAKFWPGPVGLLLTPNSSKTIQTIAKLTLGNKFSSDKPEENKMMVRLTSNDILAELSRGLGLPVVSTSANISGQPGCYDIECIKQQFANSNFLPDLVIDAGALEPSPPSTMLDLTGDKPIIIRQGANFNEVEKIVQNIKP
jgi:L-threonylcarbamoyladenylate synthase